jgi:predicted ATPase/DNA-binding CsgD family transcriptional regulator
VVATGPVGTPAASSGRYAAMRAGEHVRAGEHAHDPRCTGRPDPLRMAGVTSRAAGESLTQREAEVLAAIERRLSNPEIADELYVSVRTVESHVAALRRKLGVDSRAGLISAARARRATVVQLPHNSFVGRDDDLAALRSLLDAHRLVTVVGPAGAGKTRLALEVAATDGRAPIVADLSQAEPGGDAVTGAVAAAVGLGADGRSDLVGACGVALAAQPYLLVVDNCDHVAAEVARTAGRMLALAPSLVVLATSRAPLGAAGEAVLPLAPLDPGAAAVRLFLDRAGTSAPTRPVPASDTAVVARVCERLDGLPLAIELAAARMRHLSVTELAERLDGGLGLLDTGRPDRHATLDSALAWTWSLLDPGEQDALVRLAALPRDVDLEVAGAVVGPDAGRIVLRLLDRSLLAQATTVSDPRRFRLLHPVREFVLGRAGPAVVEEARRAHAEHQAAVVAALAARIVRDDARDLVTAARRALPDAAAALRWAVGAAPALAVGLARSLAVLAEHSGPGADALDAIARAALARAVVAQATAEDLYEVGQALCYGDLDLVDRLAAAARAKAEAAGAGVEARLAAAHLAGLIAAYRRDTPAALAHLDEAAELAAAVEGYTHRGAIDQARGIALRYGGDVPGALRAFEAAMAGYAEAGDAMHVNNTRYMMAATAASSGHRAREAVAWAAECTAYATATGNDHELAHATLAVATLDPGPGTPDALWAAAATFRAAGDLRCLTRAHLAIAGLSPSADRPPAFEEALAVATAAHDAPHQADALEGLVEAHWSSGDAHAAYVALGMLGALVGDEAALAAAPEPMRTGAGAWGAALAEGRARAPRP